MNNWYESNNNWYAPLGSESEISGVGRRDVSGSTASNTNGKKKHRGRVAGVICLALVLTLGFIFADLKRSNFSFSFTHNGETTEFSSGNGSEEGNGSFSIPGFSIIPANPDDSGEMPDSAKEFFDNFYTSVEGTSANINIPKYTGDKRASVSFQPAPDKELSLQELYTQCSDSIVTIDTYKDDAEYGMGSGIILSEDGFILTNTHVIDECDSATVLTSDNTEYEARLIGADSISDLAVIKIEASGLKPAAFGDSGELQVGDRVAAIGNPLSSSLRLTLTDGIISAIERGISYNGHRMTLLQTNTALNSGNSGGALFNMYGQVVGVTNMKMSTAAFTNSASIEGIGFAIPSATVETVVESIMEYGEVRGRPTIGITVGSIPVEAKEKYSLPDGLYISAVSKGSDAEKKGIAAGDVLTAVNGTPVTLADEVNDIKNELSVGDTMTLTIWRNGVIRDYDIVLKESREIYK